MNKMSNRKAALAEYIERRKAEDAGFTVARWAQRAGVTEGTIRAFLKKPTGSIKLENLDKLAEAENVSVSILLGDEPFLTEEEKELVSLMKDIPRQKLEGMLLTLRALQKSE